MRPANIFRTCIRPAQTKAAQLAASLGLAPSPPVSETGALLVMDEAMVAREGIAPSTSNNN
jgi:hypothetical protein